MSDKKALFEKLSFDWTEDSIRLFVTPTPRSRSLPYYIQEVGDFRTFYPYYTERKNLKSYQIIYTLGGSGHIDYMGKHYDVFPGQLLLIDCTVHHRYFTEQGKTWDFLWIHFWGPSGKGYFKDLTQGGFSPLDMPNQFQIESEMRRLLAINKKKAPGYDILSSHLIDNILTECVLHQLSGQNQYLSISEDVDNIIRDIEQHYRTALTLDTLARSHGISKFHLSRKFKAGTGTTVNEYIISTRLTHAKHYLRESELTVSQITFEIGMNNVTHFINLFKKREGMTPLAYRKMWQTGTKRDYNYKKFFI